MSTQSGPKISVVTVNYNNAAGLAKTLTSIADQNYPNIESIIVDGASTDESLRVIDKLKLENAKLITGPDIGPYDAMNKGVERATGEIIQFLNSGDVYAERTVLQRIGLFFSGNEAIDLVFGDTSFLDQAGKCVRFWRSSEYKKWKLYLGWMPNHPSSFARAELFERAGAFRTDFAIASDYEMFLRWFLIHDVRAVYHPEELTRMEVGGISNSSVSNIWAASKEVRRSWRDNGLRYGWVAPYAKILRKIPQLFMCQTR